MKKQIVNKKVWTIELTTFLDGSTELTRTNDGFNALELLGVCHKSISEINDQAKGLITPTVINRKVFKRN